MVKNLPVNLGDLDLIPGSGRSPGGEEYSSILAWRSPRTEVPGGLQSMESKRVRHEPSDFSIAHGHADVKNVFHTIVQRVKI